jgi:hypothetical protein
MRGMHGLGVVAIVTANMNLLAGATHAGKCTCQIEVPSSTYVHLQKSCLRGASLSLKIRECDATNLRHANGSDHESGANLDPILENKTAKFTPAVPICHPFWPNTRKRSPHCRCLWLRRAHAAFKGVSRHDFANVIHSFPTVKQSWKSYSYLLYSSTMSRLHSTYRGNHRYGSGSTPIREASA